MALHAGTDLECGAGSWAPGAPDAFQALGDAVKQGLVKESDLDRALRRLFRAQMKLGVYDPPERLPWARLHVRGDRELAEAPAARARRRPASRSSSSRTRAATLPLKKGLASIAVIGPNADDAEVLVGNYNGTPVAPVTVLAGIRRRPARRRRCIFARGGPLATGLPDLHVVPGTVLSTGTGVDRKARPHAAPTTAATSTAGPFSRAWTRRSTSTGRTGRPRRRSTTTPSASAGRAPSRRRPPASTPSGCAARRSAGSSSGDKPVAQGRSDHEPLTITGSVAMRAGRVVRDPARARAREVRRDRAAPLGDAGRPRRRGGGGGGGGAVGRRRRDGAGALVPPRGRGDAGADRGLLGRRPHEPRPAEGPGDAARRRWPRRQRASRSCSCS